jgi:hypothetical protein
MKPQDRHVSPILYGLVMGEAVAPAFGMAMATSGGINGS